MYSWIMPLVGFAFVLSLTTFVRTWPPTWKKLPLTNGWQSYDKGYSTPEYFKDPYGVVHLKGRIQGPGGNSTGTMESPSIVSVLPPGYRPRNQEAFMVLCPDRNTGKDSIGRIDIAPSGKLEQNYPEYYDSWITLDGITYRAE